MMTIQCLKVKIRICVEEDDGRYYAYCPELKGVHEDGDTLDEAINNAKESAHVYICSILEHNDPLPLCAEEIDMSITAMCERLKSTIFPKNKPITKFEDLDITDLSFAA